MYDPETKEQSFFLSRISYMMDLAKSLNNSGIYYPVLGICNGMQIITLYTTGKKDKQLYECKYDNHVPSSLELTSEFKSSKFWSKLDQEFLKGFFSAKNVYNSHNCGFDVNKLRNDVEFSKEMNILATGKDTQGLEYVSMVEHKYYPFIGV